MIDKGFWHLRRRVRVLSMGALFLFVGGLAGAAYQFGDKGGEVINIQKNLIKYGYKPIQNGVYDKETKWAVRLFQRDHHMTVDGIVGPETYKRLMGREMPLDKAVIRQSGNGTEASSSSFIRRKALAKALRTSASGVKHTEGITIPIEDPDDEVLSDDMWKTNWTVGSPKVKKLLAEAAVYKGVPYRFGGTTPKGFDCSGYIRYVFDKIGVVMPRSADEQYLVGKTVKKRDLRPGDLVFFETYTKGASHSGIYLGNGNFISATTSRGVAVASMRDGYWGERYIGAKRVLNY